MKLLCTKLRRANIGYRPPKKSKLLPSQSEQLLETSWKNCLPRGLQSMVTILTLSLFLPRLLFDSARTHVIGIVGMSCKLLVEGLHLHGRTTSQRDCMDLQDLPYQFCCMMLYAK